MFKCPYKIFLRGASKDQQCAFAARCDSHPLGLWYLTNNNLLPGEPVHAIIPLCSRYYDNYTAAPVLADADVERWAIKIFSERA